MKVLLAALLLVQTPVADPVVESDPLPPRRYYLRAAVETGLLLAAGAAWYWRDANPSRHPLRFDWPSWEGKLTLEALRFDDNTFNTNALGHPYAGVAYFQIARGNGLGFGGAYAAAVLSSTFWEYFVEFVETPSLNDLVMTPVAGAVVGESMFRLGGLFAAGAPTLGNRIGNLLFSPVAALNDILAGRSPRRWAPVDERGFPRDMYHRFVLEACGQTATLDGDARHEAVLGLDAVVVAHPGYRRPGKKLTAVAPGQWSRLAGRLLLGSDGAPSGYSFQSSTVLLGTYLRSYAPAGVLGTATPRGLGLMLGLGSSFDYLARDLPGGWERLASAGLLGPVAEVTADGTDVGLRLSVGAYYSIGLVQSSTYVDGGAIPLPLWRKTSPLRSEGYYHGHGLTGAGGLAVRVAWLELGMTGELQAFRTLAGRDRFQERLRGEPTLADSRFTRALWGAVAPLGGELRLTTRFEHVQRHSLAGGWPLPRSSISNERRVLLGGTVVY
jgi:hypothetical protein